MSTLTNLFSRIADAIRAKKGTEGHINASDFPDEIMSIPTGTAPTGTKSVTITQNGTRTEDVSGYANVQINTNVPNYAPTANKEFYITTNTGRIDASVLDYASVSIIVNVPQPTSSGVYAVKQSTSYPIPFYPVNGGSSKYYYFIELPFNPANYSHIAIVDDTNSRMITTRATGTYNGWITIDANGNAVDVLALNGNNVPVSVVSRRCEIFATT